MAEVTKPSVDQNPAKDPDEWVTGDEPMTGPQRSYLGTLAREAGESVEEDLSKAEASKKIDELQAKTCRGTGSGSQRKATKSPRQRARRQRS